MAKKDELSQEVAGATKGLTESTEKLERIREIVFGAQIREYSQRFDNITRDLTRTQQEVQQLVAQLSEQNRQLTKLIREQEDCLVAQLKENGRQLTQQIADTEGRQNALTRDLDQRLSGQLDESDKRFSQRFADLDQKFSVRSDELQRVLREMEESVRADLRDNAESLGQAKVDRSTLGELLMQLGSSLKDDTGAGMVVDLLQELADELD